MPGNSKRRLKGNFYYYNYLFYSEIGVTAKFQKKNWIGWSGTRADEIAIGWDNIVIEFKVSFPQNPNIGLPAPVASKFEYGNIPYSNKTGYFCTILGMDINNGQFQNALKAGGKAFLKWLKSQVQSDEDINKLGGIIFPQNSTVAYYIIPNDARRVGDIESMTHVFDSNFHIVITYNSKNSNLANLWKTGIGSHTLLPKEVKSGRVYGAARLGGAWAGVKIKK